jgi:hypothetical protein
MRIATIAGTHDWIVVGELFGVEAIVYRGDIFGALRFVRDNA